MKYNSDSNNEVIRYAKKELSILLVEYLIKNVKVENIVGSDGLLKSVMEVTY